MDEQLALDPIDRQILQILQRDASLPVREISKKAGAASFASKNNSAKRPAVS
jgi:DNA-binding Lrp family transcriptional regulator